MPMSDEERRERLRVVFGHLDRIDAGLPVVGFETESGGIEHAKEKLKIAFGKDYISTCEGCSCDIFTGDQGHTCMDGEILCSSCTPSWDDVKEQWMDGYVEGKDPDADAFMRRYQAHLAGGGTGTDLMLYTL